MAAIVTSACCRNARTADQLYRRIAPAHATVGVTAALGSNWRMFTMCGAANTLGSQPTGFAVDAGPGRGAGMPAAIRSRRWTGPLNPRSGGRTDHLIRRSPVTGKPSRHVWRQHPAAGWRLQKSTRAGGDMRGRRLHRHMDARPQRSAGPVCHSGARCGQRHGIRGGIGTDRPRSMILKAAHAIASSNL